MTRRRKSEQPIGVGLTARQMKRRKPINSEFLLEIDPITENQKNYLNIIQMVKMFLPMEFQELEKLFVFFIMLFVKF